MRTQISYSWAYIKSWKTYFIRKDVSIISLHNLIVVGNILYLIDKPPSRDPTSAAIKYVRLTLIRSFGGSLITYSYMRSIKSLQQSIKNFRMFFMLGMLVAFLLIECIYPMEDSTQRLDLTLDVPVQRVRRSSGYRTYCIPKMKSICAMFTVDGISKKYCVSVKTSHCTALDKWTFLLLTMSWYDNVLVSMQQITLK